MTSPDRCSRNPARVLAGVLVLSLLLAGMLSTRAGTAAPVPTGETGIAAAPPAGLPHLSIEARPDRLVVRVNGALFTEYQFGPETKYPHFYPVLGPRSGRTVTARQTEPYPHHSSIFFACDRVNGGNYWQEGPERGRIVSRAVRVLRDRGERVEFEQDCTWERPGAEPPFDDHRRVVITAPEADVRCLDFEVELTARGAVKVEKTNHSLFAVRVAPDLAVSGGGVLVNARGQRTEAGTFQQPAPWAVFGARRGEVWESVALFSHPANRWYPEPWFTRDYGFMSPTPLNWLPADGLPFAPGERLRLRYRVVVAARAPDAPRWREWFGAWAAE